MKKIYLIIILLFIGVLFFINKNSFIKKETNQNLLIETNKKEETNNIFLIINNKEININKDLKNIDIQLEKNNNLILSFKDEKNEITFCEFDETIMEQIEKNKYKNTYEILPGKKILKIHTNENYIYNIELNIIYNLKDNFNSFKNQWEIKEKTYKINENNIEILKDTELAYLKSFDYDKSINIETTFIIENLKNTDLKMSYGDRIYFSFDNKGIDVYLKEKNKNLIQLKKYKISEINEIKNKISTKIKLNIKYIDYFKYKYILEINGKEYEFIDEGKNNLEFERYKELKFLINNMNLKIENIEIKEI